MYNMKLGSMPEKDHFLVYCKRANISSKQYCPDHSIQSVVIFIVFLKKKSTLPKRDQAKWEFFIKKKGKQKGLFDQK